MYEWHKIQILYLVIFMFEVILLYNRFYFYLLFYNLFIHVYLINYQENLSYISY